LVHGSILYGTRGMAAFTTFCLGIGAACESLSLRTSFPFGHYSFTSLMGPKLLQVPILLVLAYLGIGYCSWVLSLFILGYRNKPLAGARLISLPLLASFIMLAWDLSMEAIWTVLRRPSEQLPRLVPHGLSFLSALCPLLQIESYPSAALFSELLARPHPLLWSVRLRKSPDLQNRTVSTCGDRCHGKNMVDDGHPRRLYLSLRSCHGTDGAPGVPSIESSRSEQSMKSKPFLLQFDAQSPHSPSFHTYASGCANPTCASTRNTNCRAISSESTGLL
jgi:hypothetical protein